MSETPEYRVWAGMKSRCLGKSDGRFKDYGGRGITVCKRWFKFENFFADMGERPSKNHSLERKDNNKGYCKSNCVWATRSEQQRNRRANRVIALDGVRRTITEWSEVTGLHYITIHTRLKRGWSIREALTTPKGKRR